MPIEKRNPDLRDCRAMQKVSFALNLAHLGRPSFAEYLIPQKCSWKLVALAIPSLLFVLSTPSFGQTLKVDGSATPASIPDAIAERFILHEMATKTKTPLNKKLKLVGLSTADAMAFGVNVMAFGDDYAKATPKDRSAVVQRYMAQLGKALSSSGYEVLTAYIASKKSRMKLWSDNSDNPSIGGCTGGGGMSTYDDTILSDFGTTNSDWEFYADEAAFGCNCDIIQGVSVTYQTIATSSTTGTVSATYPNSATVPPSSTGEPGAGTIYQITYTYAWTSCGFLVTVPYAVQNEIAFVKVANTFSPPTNCHTVAGGTVCDWPVESACSDTTHPDFKPIAIEDYEFNAWYAAADCFRSINNGVKSQWACILGYALGVSDPTPSPYCTVNP